MSDYRIKKILIVGGGTSGWIAASALSHYFSDKMCEIVLVESSAIGTVGVGEATIPTFLNFLSGIGINEREFIRATHATFKLGIEFRDWLQLGCQYFHPFGRLGTASLGADFFQVWLRSRHDGADSDLMDCCPAAVMARQGRFYPPSALPGASVLTGASYALHFDASLVADFLKGYSERRGVTRIEGEVNSVALNASNGFIEKLVLKSGQELEADFFIDCSGFRSLLLGGALGVGYKDWTQYLPCNRAVAMQTALPAVSKPYTVAHARECGWTWKIPLQNRVGNGYVYSSAHTSDQEAASLLRSVVEGEPINDPKILSFTTGVRERPWHKNCLSLGLASGFLEPLESTAIHLITRTLQLFIRMFPNQLCDDRLADEFNRRLLTEYDEIRDFIILHYIATERQDTDFWRDCRAICLPDSLREKLELFHEFAYLREGLDELFRPVSWQSVCVGMNKVPASHHVSADKFSKDRINQYMRSLSEQIKSEVSGLPMHNDFIAENCSFN